jgi:hypothetical protein
MRMVRLISTVALLCVVQVVGVHARGVRCMRIEQLPAVSDRATLGLLEAYLRERDGSKPVLIRQMFSRLIRTIDRHFFWVMPENANCKSSACYYRLLDLHNGVVRETFSFRGTGALWYFDEVSQYIDYFQDYYQMFSVETSTQSHIQIGLPSGRNPVHVGAGGLEYLPETCLGSR